jgi:hypothetical protein
MPESCIIAHLVRDGDRGCRVPTVVPKSLPVRGRHLQVTLTRANAQVTRLETPKMPPGLRVCASQPCQDVSGTTAWRPIPPSNPSNCPRRTPPPSTTTRPRWRPRGWVIVTLTCVRPSGRSANEPGAVAITGSVRFYDFGAYLPHRQSVNVLSIAASSVGRLRAGQWPLSISSGVTPSRSCAS